MNLRVLRTVFVFFVAASPSLIAHHEPLAHVRADDGFDLRVLHHDAE